MVPQKMMIPDILSSLKVLLGRAQPSRLSLFDSPNIKDYIGLVNQVIINKETISQKTIEKIRTKAKGI